MKKILIIAVILTCTLTCIAQDKWQPKTQYVKTKTDSTSVKPKFQCWGTTQKGERCKRKVGTDHSYCYQHQNQK